MERGQDDRPGSMWLAAGTGLVGVSLGAVAVLLGTRSARSVSPMPPPAAVAPAPTAVTPPADAAQASQPSGTELVGAVAQTRDSVVNLSTGRSLGAGVIVHTRGIVVTNYHVIEDALEVPREAWPAVAELRPTVTARFENGRELPAMVLVADRVEDLAILRLQPEDEDERFAAVSLGRSSTLRVGQEVFAIGNPFGLNHSVSRGIVSALDRTEVLRNRKLPLIQLDASINLGNSGGPLFALDGSLVGIVTLRRNDAEGIAFAVPVDHLRGFLDAVGDPTTPRRSGAVGMSIRGEQAGAEGPRSGYAAWVRVLGVEPQSTAAAAGVKEGDLVVEVRGKRLDGLMQRPKDLGAYLVSTVRSLFPGERLPLTLVRGSEVISLEVEIGSAPSDRQALIDAEELLGLRLRPGSGIPVIESVVPESSLTRFGTDMTGIEIVRLVDEEIESLEDLGAELSRLRARLRQHQGPLWVTVGLRSPTRGVTLPVPVLVQ